MIYDIIFCVFACDTIERYKNEIFKIKSTWGQGKYFLEKDIPYKVLFFLGEDGPLIGEDYIHLENVGNDYLSAADKQNLGIKHIYENYDFKYMFICGTDTYVLVDNLTKYIELEEKNNRISSDKELIIGGHGDNRRICDNNVHYFAGGGGLILTKKTVQTIYPFLKTMQEEWMGLCVENNYITWIPSCDLSLCYYLKKMGIVFINVHNRFFNCNYIGYNNTPTGVYKCCSQTVDLKTMISCHNMSPSDFDMLFVKLNAI